MNIQSVSLNVSLLGSEFQAKCETSLASLAIGNFDLLGGEAENASGKPLHVQRLLHL